MKEAFEKVIERLNEIYIDNECEENSGFIEMCIDAVNQVAEEYLSDTNTCSATTTVRGYRIDCDVPSDYFGKIKEVHVIDEWTEEEKIFKEVASNSEIPNMSEKPTSSDVPDNNVGENGWIPVSERLPNNTDNVNVTILVCDTEETATAFYKNKSGEWYICTTDEFDFLCNSYEVIAWQPLPAPYKPKGEQ